MIMSGCFSRYSVIVSLYCSYKPKSSCPRHRVSIKGVKSLWGDYNVFPRLGTGDTDRWRINFCLTHQCPRCPISEKRRDPPQSDLTSWILTLPRQVLAVKRQRMRIFILLSLDSSKISLSIDFFTENEKRESVSSEIIDTKLNTKNAKLLVIKTSHDNSFKKKYKCGI